MKKSALQVARAAYQPKLPQALQGPVKAVAGAATQSVGNQEEIKAMFPNTYGMPVITFEAGEAQAVEPFGVGIILSGGPNSVFEEGAPGIDPEIFELGVPVLGVCYGMQLMSQQLGGAVEPGTEREYGKTEMTTVPGNELFTGLPEKFIVWMSHGDRVSKIPAGFQVSATSGNCPYAAIRNEEKRFFGIQFHPESVLTPQGKEIIKNWLSI